MYNNYVVKNGKIENVGAYPEKNIPKRGTDRQANDPKSRAVNIPRRAAHVTNSAHFNALRKHYTYTGQK